MSVTTSCLREELEFTPVVVDLSVQEEKRWLDTLQALESVRQGNVVDGDKVHEWLESWGTDRERDVPVI